jgi:hypothetical protein
VKIPPENDPSPLWVPIGILLLVLTVALGFATALAVTLWLDGRDRRNRKMPTLDLTIDELKERLEVANPSTYVVYTPQADNASNTIPRRSGFTLSEIYPLYQLNLESLRLWLNALLSGEFPQGAGRLCILPPGSDEDTPQSNNPGEVDGDVIMNTLRTGYCCLGVAAEVAVRAGVDVEVTTTHLIDRRIVKHYDAYDAYLPDKVVQWLGFQMSNPDVDRWRSLAMLNDSGVSFEDIAKVIWRAFGPQTTESTSGNDDA